MADAALRTLLRADAEANAERPLTRAGVVAALLSSRGVQAVALHRLARKAQDVGLAPVAQVLARVSQLLYNVDISPQARIGAGLVLRHGMNVVIGAEAVVEERVRLFHGVTIGKRLSGGPGRPDGMAHVESDVLVGAGATLLGPIRVGRAAVVGAGVVLAEDVPPGAVVTAPPPTVRGRPQPSTEA